MPPRADRYPVESTDSFPPDGDEQLVRRYARARASGDRAGMRAAWEALVVSSYDRIDGAVAAWHWRGKGIRVHADDHDDAVQAALERFGVQMGERFAGTTVAELRALVFRCVDFACKDACRARLRREQRSGGSLDDRLKDESGERDAGRFDAIVANRARDEAAREDERREARDALRAALPQVANPDQRAVLVLTRLGFEVDEIAARLGTSPDNVYQLRSRGLRRLKEVLG